MARRSRRADRRVHIHTIGADGPRTNRGRPWTGAASTRPRAAAHTSTAPSRPRTTRCAPPAPQTRATRARRSTACACTCTCQAPGARRWPARGRMLCSLEGGPIVCRLLLQSPSLCRGMLRRCRKGRAGRGPFAPTRSFSQEVRESSSVASARENVDDRALHSAAPTCARESSADSWPSCASAERVCRASGAGACRMNGRGAAAIRSAGAARRQVSSGRHDARTRSRNAHAV